MLFQIVVGIMAMKATTMVMMVVVVVMLRIVALYFDLDTLCSN
jgi:hypothetical protein